MMGGGLALRGKAIALLLQHLVMGVKELYA